MKLGNQVPKGLKVSPEIQYTHYVLQMCNTWQNSLVLGRLGEALKGPHGLQEPYPNLLALHAY
jgi:hypothetical protein